jgi:hypothetical protein
MIDFIRWRLSFRRNKDFLKWMKETYSIEELERLTVEATDSCLVLTSSEFMTFLSETPLRKATRRLYKQYASDIWSLCLGAGGYDVDKGVTGLKCLSKLDRSIQVYNKHSFEEFMVRNAMKQAAQYIIEDIRNNKNK